ncbi:MAG: tetratricopeptide repeat-containing sensor histidine kinase [Candidatus Cyclobacteriaceae bacterium M3_2C_046]
MKALVVFLLLIILWSFQARSQNQTKIDSLIHQLELSQADTNRVLTLFRLTWEHLKSRTLLSKARGFADQAQDLSRELNYEPGLMKVHFYYGVMGRLEGNYQEALRHLTQHNNYFRDQGDSIKVASGLYHMAVIYSFQGRFEHSLSTYLRILRIYEGEDDQYMIATTLNSIGIIYKNLGKNQDALQNYHKALPIFEYLQAKIDQADCYTNIGNVYAQMKEYDEALINYQKALALDQELENEWGVAYQLENLGLIHSQKGNYQEAIASHQKALNIREKLGQKKEIASSLIKLGAAFNQMGQMDKSLENLKQGIIISDQIGARPELRDGYYYASQAYAGSGNYQLAYQYQQKYIEVKDSILNEETTRQINELQARYETEKKEQEIQLLYQDGLIQQAELLQQRTLKNTFIGGSVLLILVIILIIGNYRQKLRSRELLALKNEEINRQKVLELEKNQKLMALDAMIAGQESERKRIAQDLHDGLGVLLSTVQNQFSRLSPSLVQFKQGDAFMAANHMLDEACQEVRKIAHNMMPGTLLKLGLVEALQDLCLKTGNAYDLQIDFQCFGLEQRLNEVSEITIYRLVQESLNNIIKHARARQVIMQLMQVEQTITITVEDDGLGFNVKEAIRAGGIGLKNFESRVQYLNGKVTIHSEPGHGTSIQVEIPVQYELKLKQQA